MLIVDGYDWNDVEEIALFRYFADGSVGFDALKKLIILIGAQAIQAGESSHLIEERLRAMISSDIAEEVFKEIEEEKEKESERELEVALAYMEELYVGEIAAEPQSRYYSILKKLDDAINDMKDEDIQRLFEKLINPQKTAYDRIREKVSREKYVTIMSADGKPDLPEPINEFFQYYD